MDDISHSLEFARAIDPIELQIIRQRLIAIPNLIEKNIERTAFSLLVQEYKDYAVGFVDASGRLVTQSRYSLPGFVANALGLAVRAGLAVYGEADLHEGDVLIINDAATLGKHLNDVCAFTPIRVDGRLLGFFAVLVHWVDVGGAMPGSCLSPTTTEIFQEGIQYPVMKLFSRGERMRDIFRLIETNTRFPRLVMGDLEAQLGGCRMGHDMVQEILAQHGFDNVVAAMDAMRTDADDNMARALRGVPSGTYAASSFLDGDGIRVGEPIKIDVRVIVEDGTLTVDLSGVNDQVSGPFNSGRDGGAVSVARMAAKFLFSPTAPVNEGDFNRVKVEIPDGKFLSARPDAAYGSAGNTHATVVDTILCAFSHALPDQVPAGHHGIFGTHTITGTSEVTGERFLCLDAMSGGWGAFADADGPGAISLNDARRCPRCAGRDPGSPLSISHRGEAAAVRFGWSRPFPWRTWRREGLPFPPTPHFDEQNGPYGMSTLGSGRGRSCAIAWWGGATCVGRTQYAAQGSDGDGAQRCRHDPERWWWRLWPCPGPRSRARHA